MKALSYRDPWSWLVARGIKPVDNRSWSTSFRGRIYIHVSKTFDYEGYDYILSQPKLVRQMDTRGKNFCIEEFTNLAVMRPNAGKIIGEVDVVDCIKYEVCKYCRGARVVPTGQANEIVCPKCNGTGKEPLEGPHSSPWFFGNFGLVHKNPELYTHPVPCKGKVVPHFFEVPPEVEAAINKMKFENVPTEIDYDNDCAPD